MSMISDGGVVMDSTGLALGCTGVIIDCRGVVIGCADVIIDFTGGIPSWDSRCFKEVGWNL